jgi:Zn-dependent peptidase ImmA (M78 family)
MELQPIQKTTEQINAEAESFLTAYHPSKSIPIPIEEIIDLKLQIDIIPIPSLKDAFAEVGLDIDAFISSDFTSISVDKFIQEKRNNRYRFSLAHEIGHMLLHGYLYKKFKFETIDEWAAAIAHMPFRDQEIIEWQADEFAGLVLVPRAILGGELKKTLKETEDRLKISYKDRPELVTEVVIRSLALKFSVSEYVVRIRSGRDGFLTK